MQVIMDSLFARPGSAPIWDGKKGEFRTGLLLALKVACGMTIAHRNTLSKILKHFFTRPKEYKWELVNLLLGITLR